MNSFTVKGWDLERFEPEYVRSRIQEASRHGINTISLSHEIVHNAEEILFDWHRYKHLSNFCDEAHKFGMRVFLWNAQINNPPEHLVNTAEDPGCFYLNFDHPDLLSWLYDRYQRVVERVPHIDGIILGLTEGEWQIHRWPEDPYYYNMQKRKTLSALPPDERIARVVRTVYESLTSKGKSLLVRDFLRTPDEMNAFKKAIDTLPNDIGVYSKCVPNDWQYKYPPHPLLGKFPNRTQIMELDLYNETGGNDHSILLAPDYYKEQLQRARDCGLAGAIPRLDDGFATHRGTAREFNLYAYNQLIHDPNADTDPMWMAFFEPYYGNAEAAKVAIQCLKRSFDMVCANAYTLGFWTGRLACSIKYTDSHLTHHSSARWSGGKRFSDIEHLLFEGGPEARSQSVTEKKEAECLASDSLRELEKAKALFSDEKYLEITGYFEESQQQARINQVWVDAYYALRYIRNYPENIRAKEDARATLQACHTFLNTQPTTPKTRYEKSLSESEWNRFRFANLPEFVNEMETALKAV